MMHLATVARSTSPVRVEPDRLRLSCLVPSMARGYAGRRPRSMLDQVAQPQLKPPKPQHHWGGNNMVLTGYPLGDRRRRYQAICQLLARR